MEHITPLVKAIELVGLHPLAKHLGVSYQAIQKYKKTVAPAERVIGIAEATGWTITPHEIAPNIYPHPHDGLPVKLRKNIKVSA
jgi:DNA-binding transcriptional regulator YdaS (Cro superfamily)